MNSELDRRRFALGAGALVLAGACAPPSPAPARPVRLILAPCSLGLRPKADGSEPGAWRAPAALVEAGLAARVGATETVALARPTYQRDAQPETRIRNGQTLRRFMLELGDKVGEAIAANRFPLVAGGDCSVLLGCLHGARRSGGRGLVHVDGHSDFFHPGNYDSAARLGSVAGMDLALATGRGEALLARWPNVDGPLVADADTIQIGERNALDADYDSFYGDIVRTGITRMIIQDVLRIGVDETVRRALSRMDSRGIDRAWLHIDLDVLDAAVMPAVDSPGSPGFDYAQLGTLLAGLQASGRFLGAAVAIYDPELDPDGRHGRGIVAMLGNAFGGTI